MRNINKDLEVGDSGKIKRFSITCEICGESDYFIGIDDSANRDCLVPSDIYSTMVQRSSMGSLVLSWLGCHGWAVVEIMCRRGKTLYTGSVLRCGV